MKANPWNDKTTEPIYTRDAPCTCAGGDCPDCTRWTVRNGDVTYPLTVGMNGSCFIRELDDIVMIMPAVITITATFCITVWNENGVDPGNIYFRAAEPVGVQFSIGGVLYDYVTVNRGGTACVCYDGKNFVVTGGVSGWND